MSDRLWLNLGCGDDFRDEFINVDRHFDHGRGERKNALCFDLSESPWPWDDSTVDYIVARDIIEHLPDKILTMNEAYRILKPGGIFEIEVPTTDGYGAFQDPTHVSFWNRNSFLYYIDGPYRDRLHKAYGIKAKFKIVRDEQNTYGRNEVKLHIILEAMK